MQENAFILYKANRYDLKGKMFLKTLEKYYIVDMGIKNQLAGSTHILIQNFITINHFNTSNVKVQLTRP